MPISSEQVRADVIHALLGRETITQPDLLQALRGVHIESPAGIQRYTAKLEEYGYLNRVSGGWELTEESQDTGVIVLRVSPKQNTVNVAKGLKKAILPFGSTVMMSVGEEVAVHPEDDPKGEYESFPCRICGGTVTKKGDVWSCDSCDFDARMSVGEEVADAS